MRTRYTIPKQPSPPEARKPAAPHLIHYQIIEGGKEAYAGYTNEGARQWLEKNGYNQAGGVGAELRVKTLKGQNIYNFSKK
jgi:hypothetical protein